jgi:hypothetical protein
MTPLTARNRLQNKQLGIAYAAVQISSKPASHALMWFQLALFWSTKLTLGFVGNYFDFNRAFFGE